MVDSHADHFVVGLDAFLFVVVVSLCLMISYLLHKHHVSFLPDSGAAMLIGMLVGLLLVLFAGKDAKPFVFNPNIFFFVLLPPIIFEAGYTMKKKRFFRNFSTILIFAVLGTVVSTLLIGYGLYGLARAGVVPLDHRNPLECLMFGALISAVDPVATLSILGSANVGADPMMYALVFGESVLNDAVSIVLFDTFKDFHGRGAFSDEKFFHVIGEFIGVSLGSICIGIVLALASAFLLRRTELHKFPSYEFVLVFFFAYGSYCVAEILELSGIMALFFCAVFMSHYTWYNLSAAARGASIHAFKGFSIVSETFLFAYLGITAVVSFKAAYELRWNGALIAVVIPLCFLSRAAHIFPFSFLANCRRKRPIPFKMQVVLWFAGLRGAIAFALALNMPEELSTGHKSARAEIITTTMTVVIFTTLVCGGYTETLLNKLGMKSDSPSRRGSDVGTHSELFLPDVNSHDEERSMHDSRDSRVSSASSRRHEQMLMAASSQEMDHHLEQDESHASVEDEREESHRATGLHKLWKDFDRTYMKPLFGGRSRTNDLLQESQALHLRDPDSDVADRYGHLSPDPQGGI